MNHSVVANLADQTLYGCKLIDPVTGRVITIAGVRAPLHGDQEPQVVFPFEYCFSIFGRAAPSGAYKIVRVRGALMSPRGTRQSIEVATLGDDPATFNDQPTWRQRTSTPFQVSLICTATVNGVVYFVHGDAPTRTHGAYYRAPPNWNLIAAFDLESEEWKTVFDGPPVAACPAAGQEGMEWKVECLAVLKGTLSVVHAAALSWHHLHGYVNIWRLVDSVWVKECTTQMPQSCRFFKPLEILEDGSVMMATNFRMPNRFKVDFRCALQLYNTSTKAVVDVMDMAPDFISNMTLYTGSLLS